MSLMPHFPDGYYDDEGQWQRTKFCFVSCGAACTCGPPLGQWYSAAHDKRGKLEGAEAGSGGGYQSGGRALGIETSDALHVPVEGTDTPAQSAEGTVTVGSPQA